MAFLRCVAATVKLHRTALDVEHSIGSIPLRKNDLVVSVVPPSHSRTELLAENCRTETERMFVRHCLLGRASVRENAVLPPWKKSLNHTAQEYGSTGQYRSYTIAHST